MLHLVKHSFSVVLEFQIFILLSTFLTSDVKVTVVKGARSLRLPRDNRFRFFIKYDETGPKKHSSYFLIRNSKANLFLFIFSEPEQYPNCYYTAADISNDSRLICIIILFLWLNIFALKVLIKLLPKNIPFFCVIFCSIFA